MMQNTHHDINVMQQSYAKKYDVWIWPHLLMITVIVCCVLAANTWYFGEHIYLIRESAFNSIGTYQAGTWSRVYGTPSLNLFYYPGPGWMYLMAGIEYILNILNIQHIVPAPFLGILVINIIALSLTSLMIHKIFNDAIVSITVFTIFIIWIIGRSEFITLPWEPRVTATIYLAYLSTLIVAFKNTSWSMSFAAGVLGGLSLQVHSYPILAIVASSLLFSACLISGRHIKLIAAHLLGALIMAWPLAVDVLLYNAKNIQAIRNWSETARSIGQPDWSACASMLYSAVFSPSIKILVLTSLATGAIFLCTRYVSKIRPEPIPVQNYLPLVFFALGPCTALLFYRFFLNTSYLAPQTGVYAFYPYALFFSVCVGYALMNNHLKYSKITVMTFSIIILCITIVNTQWKNYDKWAVIYSEHLTHAISEISKYPDIVNIHVDLAPLTATTKDENIDIYYQLEYLYGYAVGMANMLHRKAIPFCLIGIRNKNIQNDAWWEQWLSLAMDTKLCPNESTATINLTWEKDALLLKTPGAEYDVSPQYPW